MMMATAGSGGVIASLAYENKKRPMSRAAWLVIGGSILLHGAVGVWIYNQNFHMPVETIDVDTNAPRIFMTPLPRVETPTPTIEPPAPPIPVNNPTTVRPTEVPPLPIQAPENPTVSPPAGNPITLNPIDPPPVTGGTATNPTPPTPVSVISNPRWIDQPSAAQMERAYPRRAAEAGVGGRVLLSCTVTAQGSVNNCGVTSETPASMGFGRAAIQLSQHFRISPRTVDGRPVEGAQVTIPLNFGVQ